MQFWINLLFIADVKGQKQFLKKKISFGICQNPFYPIERNINIFYGVFLVMHKIGIFLATENSTFSSWFMASVSPFNQGSPWDEFSFLLLLQWLYNVHWFSCRFSQQSEIITQQSVRYRQKRDMTRIFRNNCSQLPTLVQCIGHTPCLLVLEWILAEGF